MVPIAPTNDYSEAVSETQSMLENAEPAQQVEGLIGRMIYFILPHY
jgi:hypothetical protein